MQRQPGLTRLPAGAPNPFFTKLTLDPFVGDGSTSRNVCSPAPYSLKNIEVKEHAIEAAIFGKLVEYRTNLLLGSHGFIAANHTLTGGLMQRGVRIRRTLAITCGSQRRGVCCHFASAVTPGPAGAWRCWAAPR